MIYIHFKQSTNTSWWMQKLVSVLSFKCFSFSLVAFGGLLLFFPVYFCFRLAGCGRACLTNPNEANLNLRSSDPMGRAES